MHINLLGSTIKIERGIRRMEKKRGRPSTGLYRKKQIKIYVTENEYERIRYLAEVHKLSVNKFILQKILN